MNKNDFDFEIDFDSYPPKSEIQKEFKDIIMEDIKRKDKEFYDKWCNNETCDR